MKSTAEPMLDPRAAQLIGRRLLVIAGSFPVGRFPVGCGYSSYCEPALGWSTDLADCAPCGVSLSSCRGLG